MLVIAAKKISCTFGGKTFFIYEALFASTFSLPNQGLSDISQLTQPIILTNEIEVLYYY